MTPITFNDTSTLARILGTLTSRLVREAQEKGFSYPFIVQHRDNKARIDCSVVMADGRIQSGEPVTDCRTDSVQFPLRSTLVGSEDGERLEVTTDENDPLLPASVR